MKILIIGGISHSLVNFRGPLLQALVSQGYEVLACAGEVQENVVKTLASWNVAFIPIHLGRTGMNPWEDIRTCWDLWCIMRKFQPDTVLAYTIKPVIWGGIASRITRNTSMFSLITGLGYAFVSGKGARYKVAGIFANLLYRLSLGYNRLVFFQNRDDEAEFKSRGFVQKEQCMLVNGTGVDLAYYGSVPLPSQPCFLMMCRLIKDKGVREYVDAARIIKERFPSTRFKLAGPMDSNPRSVTKAELDRWKSEGVIEYLGVLDDVRSEVATCNVYVLPSYYREGTPRTILEAMSMGRPIITTNAPGCRETIRMKNSGSLENNLQEIVQGENGFLVPVRNIQKLARVMENLIVNTELRIRMGEQSRIYAEAKYDVHQINAEMLRAMNL